jgi:RNA polymerase sigma factor (TIGR02999 family)
VGNDEALAGCGSWTLVADKHSLLPVSDVTRILDRVQQGDPQAAEELLPLVYNELRKLAAHKMAGEAAGHTLQPTALVHEAWLRLGGSDQAPFANRAHFFGAAAEAMRRILVESARCKARSKRGGNPEIEELDDSKVESHAPSEEVLAVHEALDLLAAEEPLAAEVVKLRYFVGLPIPKVAKALNIAPRTADRLWAFARVRLKHAIRGEPS